MGQGAFPQYRRRNNGRGFSKWVKGEQVWVDNTMVVPFNAYMSLKWDCHINVEVCTSIKCVKYIFKYVHKGSDRATVAVAQPAQAGGHQEQQPAVNEIDEYIDGRYIGPCEAAWRLFSFKMHDMSHTVIRLAIHLPDQEQIFFQDGADLQQVVGQERVTTLQGFFNLCALDPEARQYVYTQIPKHYVWNDSQKKYTKRQRNGDKVRFFEFFLLRST